ncbi:MAG: hypothetical protein QS721_03505 [Candidatus Endonucleobacter sp. (ex Gigantidas childressi)]|nr:hypothetical protein [Candidatus Endonucleobacter sp. (ex Gigantidas childressi)]
MSFNLGSTHLTNLDWVDKLMGLLTIVVVRCLLVGRWVMGMQINYSEQALPSSQGSVPIRIG